jgi:hypothetical protein
MKQLLALVVLLTGCWDVASPADKECRFHYSPAAPLHAWANTTMIHDNLVGFRRYDDGSIGVWTHDKKWVVRDYTSATCGPRTVPTQHRYR